MSIINNAYSRQVEFYDTTLRDGSQTRGVQFSLKDKLSVIDLLDDFGIDIIECGWNGANATDTDLFKILAKHNTRKAKLAAFTSSCATGKRPQNDSVFQRGTSVDVPVITLFSKFWDFQITHALKTTIEHNQELIFNSVSYCKARFDQVVVDAEHFFDGYKSNPEIAIKALETAIAGGADCIVLCDTNGGTLPSEVIQIFQRLKKLFPATQLGIHCHNDADMAVANSVAAFEHGAVQVQGTINGIGERCGNTNLCSLIPNLVVKYGIDSAFINQTNLHRIRHVADVVSSICHRVIPPTDPYVGEHAFTHKAGVHISSVLKHPECYEHVRPEIVGNTRHLPISEQSGRAAMKYRLEKLGYQAIQDRECESLLREVKERCYEGVLLDDADASLELLVHRFMARYREAIPVIELEHLVISELHGLLSDKHYRLEIGLNVNGRLLFNRDFGTNLSALCWKSVRHLLGDEFYICQRAQAVLDRVDKLHKHQIRSFFSFTHETKKHRICVVESSEDRAVCRAIIDVISWHIYQQNQVLGLSETA